MRSRFAKIFAVFMIVLLAIAFPIGGGFGSKANNARLDGVDVAYFAHRAGAVAFPENCMDGVIRARSLGYSGVELDIHETKDHQFILFHDDDCERMLGMDGAVAGRTLAELQERTLLLNGTVTTSRVTTLDSALARSGDPLLFYLDTKFAGLDQADRLVTLIEQHHVLANTLVASSSIPFITYLEFRHPEVNTVLEGFDKGEEWTYALFPKNFRPDFLSSFAFETDSAQVAWLSDHHLLRNKIVYGMDSASFARMQALGITRFIVDEGVPPIGH